MRPLIAERDPLAGFSGSLRVYEEVPGGGVRAPAERATRQSFAYQEFRVAKPRNGFRIFGLGGSSAVGFPWGADHAFLRLLGDALQEAYPERVVEAVNAAAMSYASHRLRILARELVDYEPDVFVIYGGHNEFVERRFYRRQLERFRALDPLRRALYRGRLFSLLWRALGPAPGSGVRAAGESPGALLGLEVVREKGLFGSDAERREVERTFEENLRAIVDLAQAASAQVVLCTVVSNLRDWRPHHSLLDAQLDADGRDRFVTLAAEGDAALAAGDAAGAAALLEQARELSPGHADVHFQLGRAYEALARFDDARAAYRQARDHDAQPARAPSALNDVIRRLAAERGLPLLDVERRFEEASPHGLVGFDLIEDYVHPKPEGHRLIALPLYELFLRRGLLGEPREPDPAAFAAAAERGARRAAARPGDDAVRRAAMLYNTGYVLARQGHREQAMEKYRACLEINPFYSAARLNLGVLLYGAGRNEEALEAFETVLNYDPDNQQARVSKGWALLALERYAVAVFREATEHDPLDPQAWHGLGTALQVQAQRWEEAAGAFRRALELEPRHAEAACGLGEVLLRAGRSAEAVARFRRCAELRPADGASRAWLGFALQQEGDREGAIAAYRAALALDPANPYARQGLAELSAPASAVPRR